MAGHHAFMKKDGGKIEKVPLSKWARYRASGYEFSDEDAYNKQQAQTVAEAAPTSKKKVSKKKKKKG